jgi:hypothetical protein
MYFLLAVGQARVVKEIAKRQDIEPINGVITSLNVLEGDGCPAGTYHPGSFEAGRSINTFVDFDSFVLTNNQGSDDTVICTLSIDYEIVYPKSGEANIAPAIQTHLETKDGKDTEFHLNYNVEGNLDDSRANVIPQTGSTLFANANMFQLGDIGGWSTSENGADEAQFGLGLYSKGTAGEIGTGSFKTRFTLTTTGEGSIQVQKIEIGFGIFYDN